MAQAERYAFIVENFDHHSSMNRRYQFFYYLDTREIEMVSHNEDLAFGSRARRAHENESSPRSLTLLSFPWLATKTFSLLLSTTSRTSAPS